MITYLHDSTKPLQETSSEHYIFILLVLGRQRHGEKYLIDIYCVPRTQQSGLQILFYLIIKSSFNYTQPNSSSEPPVLVGWMSVLGMCSTGILILFQRSIASHKILIVKFSLYEDFGIPHSFRLYACYSSPFKMIAVIVGNVLIQLKNILDLYSFYLHSWPWLILFPHPVLVSLC